MISGRRLSRDEIRDIWTIDRGEVIDAVYYLENGSLRLRPVHHDVSGWPPGEAEQYTPILESCHDRGGWLHGLFDEDRLMGVAVLESQFMGKHGDQLQLKFLHVSRPYRSQGWGQRLFGLAKAEAAERGATGVADGGVRLQDGSTRTRWRRRAGAVRRCDLFLKGPLVVDHTGGPRWVYTDAASWRS